MTKRSHRRRKFSWLLGSVNQPRESLTKFYSPDDFTTLEGAAGSGFLEDTSCYHRASPHRLPTDYFFKCEYTNMLGSTSHTSIARLFGTDLEPSLPWLGLGCQAPGGTEGIQLTPVEILIRCAMSRNSSGVVLCGMNQANQLKATIEIRKKKILTSTALDKVWDSIRRLDP